MLVALALGLGLNFLELLEYPDLLHRLLGEVAERLDVGVEHLEGASSAELVSEEADGLGVEVDVLVGLGHEARDQDPVVLLDVELRGDGNFDGNFVVAGARAREREQKRCGSRGDESWATLSSTPTGGRCASFAHRLPGTAHVSAVYICCSAPAPEPFRTADSPRRTPPSAREPRPGCSGRGRSRGRARWLWTTGRPLPSRARAEPLRYRSRLAPWPHRLFSPRSPRPGRPISRRAESQGARKPLRKDFSKTPRLHLLHDRAERGFHHNRDGGGYGMVAHPPEGGKHRRRRTPRGG